MKLRELVNEKFKEISYLSAGVACSVLILILRIKLTQEFFLLFLGWNLLLALIPFIIALIIYKNPELMAKPWSKIGFTFLWLLFLPNAPYIITDFIHLQLSNPTFFLLDFLTIASFALTGFFSGIYSFKIMRELYSLNYAKKMINVYTVLIAFLCGFGVYLGRVIRLNSWDIFINPWKTFIQIMESTTQPLAWLVAIFFGTLMLTTLFRFKSIVNGLSNAK
ncbi:DUF1361 domain-containing protein [Croceitalea marina]|uniref:DUF1361 domain-containing protein n=1 Tax=Croceitalea marina TaxID=1775166 RepID=A0ABW5MUZ5_9FLAO